MIHQHDCPKCKFLGVYKDHDLYFCDDTIVARYGSEGSAYISGLVFADTYPELYKARELAIEKGYI